MALPLMDRPRAYGLHTDSNHMNSESLSTTQHEPRLLEAGVADSELFSSRPFSASVSIFRHRGKMAAAALIVLVICTFISGP